MYRVINGLKLKAQGVVKTFYRGNIIDIPESAAQKLIEQGKLEPVFKPANDLAERMAIQGENMAPEQTTPYITEYGVLVIPWNSPQKYRYWRGGQSIVETLKELGRCDLIPKYRSIYSDN